MTDEPRPHRRGVGSRLGKPNRHFDWQEPFLRMLAATASPRLAAKAAKIDRSTAYYARDRDPLFAAKWKEALEDAIDMLEAEARRRALRSSDWLLWRLLASLKPDVYAERARIDHNAGGEVVLKVVYEDELAQRAKLITELPAATH